MKTLLLSTLLLGGSLFAFDYEVQRGWNLLGAVEDIDSPYSVLDTKSIVMFKDGRWSVGSSVENIKKGYGFWLYSDKDGVISDGALDSEEEAIASSSSSLSSSASSSQAIESETIESSLKNWLLPSKSFCQSNGASWDSAYSACYGYRDDAETICQKLGGSSPALSDVNSIITKCGGVPGSYSSNYKNEEYQACYKELGFRPSFIWVREQSLSKFGAVDMQNGTYYLYNGDTNLFGIKCIK